MNPEPKELPHSTAVTIEDDEIVGASKVELAMVAIRDAGHALRPSEMMQYFKEKGYTEWGEEFALGSLIKALVRRAKHSGDIFKLPGARGAWDLTSRYDQSALAIILSNEVIAQDVARIKQSKRTKDGLARARARGIRMGPSFKISREQGVLFKKMLREGRPPREIRAAFNISSGTYYNYSKRLADWDDENGPWPPPSTSEDDDADNIVPFEGRK